MSLTVLGMVMFIMRLAPRAGVVINCEHTVGSTPYSKLKVVAVTLL